MHVCVGVHAHVSAYLLVIDNEFDQIKETVFKQ